MPTDPVPMQRPDWALATLTELISGIGEARTSTQAIRETVDASVEALDAEIGALLRDGAIVASIGFRSHDLDAATLWSATTSRHSSLDVIGLGRCATLAARIEGHDRLYLVTARTGDAQFSPNEAALLDSMGNTLGLMLTLLQRLDIERELRNQAAALLEITNAIARRYPHDTLYKLITQHTASLLKVDGVIMRAVTDHGAEGSRPRVIRCEGLNPSQVNELDAITGLGGVAISSEHVVELYGEDMGPVVPIIPNATGALVAPVFMNGVPLGSLGVFCTEPNRRYDDNERTMLQALAELASIVFTDAYTLQAVTAARHDFLTGLPGRGLILDQLASQLSHADAGALAVFFLDIDEFKPINDRFGHEVGDAALRILAERMRALVGNRGAVGRIGGDEFVAFMVIDEPGAEERSADALVAEIGRPIPVTVGQRVIEVAVSASIGVAISGPDSTASELLRESDSAMYQAKATGRNRWRRFVRLAQTHLG